MSTLDDLLVVCCDAPAADQRAQADLLLYDELTTRLALTGLTYSFDYFPAIGHGGPERAGVYFSCGGTPPANAAALGGVAYQAPVPTGTAAAARQAALDAIATDGAALVAAVRATMGNAFDAGRRQVRGQRVAVGGSFVLYSVLQQFTDATGANFSFPPGTYTVQLAAALSADDVGNPATATFGINANGVHALTLSATRTLVDQHGQLLPTGDARRYDYFFATMTGSLTLATTSTITLVNAGSVEQGAIGILRVFPA